MRKLLFSSLLLLSLCGCLELDYYLHTATGHLQIISKRQSIRELLQQQQTPRQLQEQLAQIAEIRDFASQSLLLPENDSYRSFVKLDRPYVVWNVIATPEFSLDPLQWCFPIAGCVSYRGYFEQDKAERFAQSLREDANDTLVVGVPAYSTLSWFDDPVLSTFSDWPIISVAQLIFHELGHQKLYVPNDTVFNESFATAVEQLGIGRWLEQVNDPEMAALYRRHRQRQLQFHQLLLATRAELEELYTDDFSSERKRQQKLDIFAGMRHNYQQLRQSWEGYQGYDAWFAEVNNAKFASINNYHRWVPAFKLIIEQEGQDLEKFYWRCRVVADLPAPQRQRLLDQLSAEYQTTTRKQPNDEYSPDSSL